MENHRNVVVGVTAIAMVVLFWGFFVLAIVIATVTNPPEPTLVLDTGQQAIAVGDYLSPGRLVVGVVAGVVGSLALWAWVDLRLYATSRFDRVPADDDDEG